MSKRLKSMLRRKHDILTNNNCAITNFSSVLEKRNKRIAYLKKVLEDVRDSKACAGIIREMAKEALNYPEELNKRGEE